ncbi:protein disulfide isomerase [Trichosporon asahii var. asahii CBS 8904]|uniref:Protein disulfide isomerase n=1 Tax=Trichosporon asahii var. asahii (strain CBS 8904) TaxID=1220162 RepID=K1VH90_TRIAC|nr:protein disulfide isomerase [Trichosporon asahii var. asahii CBS 8904]
MHLPSLAVTLSGLAALVQVHAGMYGAPVVELDAKSFKDVMGNEHASMVAFVAPWCGHCKNLGPEFTAAAQSLSPLIPFYTVDCDEDKNRALCAQYGVQGFPTIKAFPRAGKGSARDYNGERRRGALVEYAKTLVPDRVKKLRVDGPAEPLIKGFLKEKKELPHALLVHPSQPSIPFLWKVLGHRLSSKDAAGDVLAIADEAGGDARLLFWPAGADQGSVEVYKGPMKFNPLLEWLEAALEGDIRPSEEEEKEKPSGSNSGSAKKAQSGESEAERRARLRAKMDEAERRDKIRREKLAAQRAAQQAQYDEDEENASGTETAPDAEPAEDADDEVAAEEPGVAEPVESEDSEVADGVVVEEGATGTESAPDAEPAEDADDEVRIEDEDELEEPVEDDDEDEEEEEEKFEHDEL